MSAQRDVLFAGGPRDGQRWTPASALPTILPRERNDAGGDPGCYERAYVTSPVGIMVPRVRDNSLIYEFVTDPDPDGLICEFLGGPLGGSRRVLAAHPSEWIVPGSESAGHYSRNPTADTPVDLVRYTWRESLA